MSGLSTIETILTAGVVVIFLWLAYLSYAFLKSTKQTRKLFTGAKGKNLELILDDYLSRVSATDSEILRVKKILERLDSQSKRSIQKIGFLRFNPFGDTGGDQSFAVAFLDLLGNGVVVSSLHGREGTRVYAKAVQDGKSEYSLTDEEQAAIKKAISS